MAPSVGQIYQVTYQQSLAGQLIENVIHFQERTGTSTPAQIDTSVQGFFTQMSQVQTTDCIYTAIIVKQMTPVAFDERIVTPITASGAQSSARFPTTVACVLTKRTGIAGKSHRGRIYVGAVPTVFATSPDRLNTAGGTAFGTFAGAVMGLYGELGSDTHLQIGVYSRAIGGGHPFTLAGFLPLTSIDTQIIFGNQRRRRVGVGV